MKQFSHKIVSFTLAFFVLFSTFSFTVEKHYCGDFLMDVSFTGDVEDCGMQMEKKSKKKNCCKDEVHKFEGQDELQTQKIEKLSFEKQQVLTAFFISYKDLFASNQSNTNFYKDFSPPDIPKDFQILHQSFLI